MEAGGGWCSNVITAQSLNTAPILATGRLHGPLKFVAFAQDLFLLHVSSCEASGECSSCGDEINQLRKENKISEAGQSGGPNEGEVLDGEHKVHSELLHAHMLGPDGQAELAEEQGRQNKT